MSGVFVCSLPLSITIAIISMAKIPTSIDRWLLLARLGRQCTCATGLWLLVHTKLAASGHSLNTLPITAKEHSQPYTLPRTQSHSCILYTLV